MQKILEYSSYRSRLFYLILFSLVGSFMASAIVVFAANVAPLLDGTVWYYRLSIMLQDIFVMFLPAYAVCKWITDKPMQLLGVKKDEKMPIGILFGLLVFVTSYPAISIIAHWNEQVVFPESLKVIENWMRTMENAAKQVTDLLLSGNTALDFVLNLLIIAAAAAFVEELFFRGALQHFLEKWMDNGHAAVWIAAFIFSAIHLQFYGFFPRLIMGAILGYLFLYSRNLWVPILYHFVNNALVISVTFVLGNDNFLEKLGDRPLTWGSAIVLVTSVLLTYFAFSRLKKQLKKDDSN